MGQRKSKAIASTLLILGIASALAPDAGYAQQSSSPMSGVTPAGSGRAEALTGGTGGATYDKGMSGAQPVNPGMQGSTSGSSGTGNAMTGGAEASPTDQGTSNRSAVQPSNAAGAAFGFGSSAPQQPDRK